MAIGMYLLSHCLRNRTLIGWCTDFLCSSVTRVNACELWSVANATDNELLIVSTASQVALNWEICSAHELFLANTEVVGMKKLLNCTQMSPVSAKSKLFALSAWIRSARDAAQREIRIEAFRDLISSPVVQLTPDVLVDLLAESVAMELPRECGQWLVELCRIGKPVTSSLSSETDFNSRCEERLATIHFENEDTVVRIHKQQFAEVEAELKLEGRKCYEIISFQSKLVFIGGWEGYRESRRVDLMDPMTGLVLPLPEMAYARSAPACATNNHQIFVFGEDRLDTTDEFYGSGSEIWLPLPSMIVSRYGCTAVYVPDTGVLVLGGYERASDNQLKETELLTCESDGGKDNWKWRPTAPMLYNRGSCRAVCFEKRVYVVSCGDNVSDMEMLDLSAGAGDCQWTSLASFDLCGKSLQVFSMTRVGSKLFISGFHDEVYVFELEDDPKIQHEKLLKMKQIPRFEIARHEGIITVPFTSS
ncbi:hypothetical protein Aperf_G00000108289 [Anoplocephala perfoliata]